MSKTLKEIRDNIKNDLDLNEEGWKEDSDFNGYINDAIKYAHRQIVNIHEDYFLTSKDYTITSTDESIDYPDNIYLNKIKGMYLIIDQTPSEIKPVRRFDEVIMSNIVSPDGTYVRKYLSTDSLASGRILKLFPKFGYDGDINLWYIREPKLMVDDTDICDIDEFSDFIEASVRTRYYNLDGDPRGVEARNTRNALRKDMIDSFTNMNESNDDTVIADYTHYENSV